MKKSSSTTAKRFKRPFSMCGQKSEGCISELNMNYKKLKKNVCDVRNEISCCCNQQLKSNSKYRNGELSRSITDKNMCKTCGKLFISVTHENKQFCGNINDKPLKCKICGKTFRHQNNLKMHYRVHFQDKSSAFNKTRKTFRDKSPFNRHLISYSLRKRIPSSKCLNTIKLKDHQKAQISTNSKYKMHLRSNDVKAIKQKIQLKKYIGNQENDMFSCSTCKKSFNRKYHLKRHFNIHSANRLFSCGTCEKTFKRKDHLTRHFGIHSNDKPFSCYKCMKAFKHKNHLTLHNRIHLQYTTFSCKKCEKTFKKEIHLKRHLLIHSRNNAFARNKQGKVFKLIVGIKRRIDTNREDKPFALKACKKMFIRRNQKRDNSDACTKDTSLFSENFGKDYNHQYELVRTIITDNKSDSFKCCLPDTTQENSRQLDGKVCAGLGENHLNGSTHSKHTTESELVAHMNTCTEESPRDLCGIVEEYANDIELNQRKSTHITEYTIVCSYCGEKFKRHGDLQRHLRVHRSTLKITTKNFK